MSKENPYDISGSANQQPNNNPYEIDMGKVKDQDYTEQTGIEKENIALINVRSFKDFYDWWNISDEETQEKATAVESIGERYLKGTFAEHWFGKNQLTDLLGDFGYRTWDNSWNGTKDLQEFLEVYSVESSDQLNEEQMVDLYAAMDAQRKVAMSDEMLEFMRETNKKENSGTFNWISALSEVSFLENPTVAIEAALSTFIGMGTALGTSSEARKTTAKTTAATTLGYAAAGGGIGSMFAGVGAIPGLIIGAKRGFGAGLFAGVNKSIETGMTFGDQLRKEVEAAGLEWSEESVKKILKSTEKDENGLTPFERIKNKALVKGSTVMAVDMLANTIAPGLGGLATKQTGKRALGAAVALTTEGTGGAFGEYISSKAIGEKASIKELQLEFLGEFGASGPVSVFNAIKNPPSYKINNKKASSKDVKALLKDEKITDQEFVNIPVDIKNNTQLYEEYNNRLSKIAIKAQVDPRVNQESDVNKIIDLEQKLQKITGDTQSAKSQKSELVAEIKNITDKYKPGAENFVDARTADVKARKKAAGEVEKAFSQKNIAATVELAKQGKQIGNVKDSFAVENNKEAVKAYKEIQDQYGKDIIPDVDITNVDGVFVPTPDGNVIIINKEIAAKTGQINVGGHELLHAVVQKHYNSLTPETRAKFVNDFKNTISKKSLKYVQDRVDARNKDGENIQLDSDEYLTIYSDGIVKQEITYDESASTKIKNFLQNIFRKFGYNKEFGSGLDTYNFMRDYNKNIMKFNKISKRALDVAGSEAVAGKASLSRGSLIEDINKLQQGATTKTEFQKSNIFNNVFKAIQSGGAINNYIRSLQMSAEKTRETIDSVTDRLINFDPAAKRKDGTVIGPEGLGEFIMANVGFGKLDAAKSLAVKAKKAKKTTTIDAKEAKELEDTSIPTTEIEDKTKPRNLKDFNIELEDGLVDAEIIAEVEALLEKNPDDIELQMEKLILKDIRKKLDNVVGKIAKNKDTGKREPTPEYESFIRKEYDEVVSSLGMETIRKAYRPWFEKKKIRTEKYKGTSPTTGKVTNYVKDVFENTTNKREYIRWFLEGNERNLTERRTALIRRIARRKTKIAVDNYIEINSKDLSKIAEAKLRKVSRAIEDTQSEQKSFDSVRFSKTLKPATLFQEFAAIKRQTKKVKTKWIGYINPYTNLPQTFVDLGRMYEQAFANHFMRMKIKGLEVVSTIASEVGGMADFVMRYNGKIENHELKASITAFMGSISISSFKNGNIKLATDVHNNLLDEINKNEFAKGYRKRIDFVNKGIERLNKTRAENKQYDLIDPDITSGKPQYIPYELYMDKKGFGNKVFYQLKSDESVIQRHYAGKDVNSLSFVGTKFGNMSVSLNENSILNLPMLSADTDVNFTFRNSGSKMINGNKMIALSLGVQFKISKLKNNPRTTPDITIKEDAQKALGINFSKSINGNKLNNAIKMSRTISDPKGITVLDFDDTLATTKSLVKFTTPDGTTGTLNAEEYASTYEDLLDKGYVFDFSDFNKVVKGKLAPLFNKAIKLQGKFGPENMFVLTARPPQAQKAIFDFLKANGLNIPLKNITGLGNSTAEAKALWVADKVGEGFNDFYFADDALQNVQAVKNMLDQFDVKSKVQQARVKFSNSLDTEFNDILENVTGIESFKRFERTKARKRGADKGKFRLFIPPSHEDFVGLLYNFMGKGKKGDAHRNFFEQALVRPLNRAYKEVDTAKQAVANDYKALNKQMPEVNKMLSKKTPDGDFTYQDAIRVYLWDKHGYKIPGLSPVDQQNLVNLVKDDGGLQSYADTLNVISKQEAYVDPGPSWESGNIRIDLVDATGRVGRASYFAEFQENADTIFSEENLNKIEAAYGTPFREALEDMLHRTKTGVNRPKGSSSKPNIFMNWLNASVAGVMFLNVRSSLLQQMSNVNYLNFADNNILAAGLAFANQPQYWKDFAMIFNSDMLKQRRGGLQTDINGAELAEAIKKARPGNLFDQVAIITGKALRLGFLPTQIGDNIAIATGGAAYYRNRVNKYIKDGLSKKEAETKAFTDFQDITQSTQQSARPDMTSKQQASWIGKLVLNFLNTPSQYNRIIKKAGSDILNKRITPPNTSLMQSNMSNASRILYYGAAQNLIFYSLQTALFAVMFGSDDEDEDKRVEQYLKKKERVINGSIDTILRGSGIYGVAVSTLKNMTIKFLEQREKGYNKDESAVVMELFNFSPVVGIKARRIVNAEKTLNYNKKVIEEMETFDIDNPMWSAVTNYTQTITTAPVNKIYQKTINLRNAADRDYTALQRLLFFSGYTTWSLNLGDTKKMKEIKQNIKDKNKSKKKKKIRKLKLL